jgi:hypothetical protein
MGNVLSFTGPTSAGKRDVLTDLKQIVGDIESGRLFTPNGMILMLVKEDVVDEDEGWEEDLTISGRACGTYARCVGWIEHCKHILLHAS